MGQSIQEWGKQNKICGIQPLKNLKGYGLFKEYFFELNYCLKSLLDVQNLAFKYIWELIVIELVHEVKMVQVNFLQL